MIIRTRFLLLLLLGVVATAHAATSAKAPNLQISVQQRSFYTGKPAQLLLSTYNLPQAQLALYQVPLETLAPNAAVVSETNIKTTGSLPYRLAQLKLTKYRLARQIPAKVAKPHLDYWDEQTVKVTGLASGVYVVSARGGGVEKRTWFAVSSRALLTKRSPREVLAWVVNAADGRPATGVPVALFDAKGKAATGITTGEGLVKLTAPPLGTPAWIATQAGDPAFALASSPERQDPYKAQLYTDRPVYRPGQLIHFRGSVREYAEGKYSLPSATIETVRAQIKTRAGSIVYDQRLPLNRFGSFDGEFQLAPEPPLGSYELAVTVGNGAKETTFVYSFWVEAYRKPEFTVDVKFDKALYRGGDEIAFTVAANYLFGSPVSGGKVRYTVSFQQAGQTMPAEILTAAGLGTAAIGQIEDSVEGNGRLDKNGQLRVTLKTKSLPYDRYVVVSAEVSETALRPRSGNANTFLTAAAYRMRIFTERTEYIPGETVDLLVKTETYEGKPISAAVNLRLIENLVDRENRPYQQVTKKTIETNSQGEARVPFVVKRLGRHRFEAWSKDAGGNAVFATTNISVLKTKPAHIWPNLTLTADKNNYKPGETAGVTVRTDQLGAWLLVTVEGERILSSRVYRVQDHQFTLRIPITPEMQPNVQVHAAIIRKGELTAASVGLTAPLEEKRLQVIVTPNKDRYQPAETASYTIVTRDSKGVAVPAEVGLGVVDKGVYEVREDNVQNPFAAWWGERANRIETDFSLANMYPGGAYQTIFAIDSTAAPAEYAKAGRRAAGADGEEAPRVRRFFTDTAYWGPSVVTGPDGSAQVSFVIPDNLTTWRATARGLTSETQAGQDVKDIITTLPLLVRFTLPRFYVQGDEATAAVSVHNYTGEQRQVKVTLSAEGVELLTPAEQTITLPKEGIQRLTWKIKVTGTDKAHFLVSADGGPGGKDAMEATLPVLPDGVKDVVAAAGMTASKDSATLTVPENAVMGSALAEVSLSPSLAGPIFEALEYLTTYPYGCAEQTMDGFLPDLIVANTLQKLGAQRPRPKLLDRYVSFGLQKLLRYQHSDGGWHWWEFDESDPYISAYVVYGLKMADSAGSVGAHDAMVRGVQYLREALTDEQFRDAQAYLLWALAYANVWDQESLKNATSIASDLFTQRAKLDYFSRASLALALQALSANPVAAERATLAGNAKTLADELDAQAQPLGVGAFWAADGRYQYSWLDNNVEVTSQVLSALLTIKPDSQNIVPAIRWIMAARKGKAWSSTKDTAAAVLVLTKYLAQAKELQQSFTARVYSGDKLIKEVKFGPQEAFADAQKIAISALDLKPGDNTIRIEKEGAGNVYWAARLSYLLPGQQVVPVAKGITIERKYQIPAEDPSVADLTDPGNIITVTVTVRADENLRYALLQEPIPAGCEVIEGDEARIPEIGCERREVWDNRLVLYFDYLPQGETSFTYAMRTEAPGNYRILPTSAELMYFPEVRGWDKPVRLKIGEAKPE